MPTVLRSGPYRFYFYSSDDGEPLHVHVAKDLLKAKFWLDPVRLAYSALTGQEQRLATTGCARKTRKSHDLFINHSTRAPSQSMPTHPRLRRPRCRWNRHRTPARHALPMSGIHCRRPGDIAIGTLPRKRPDLEAIAPEEAERAPVFHHVVPTLVHQPMMEPADGNEVGQTGRAAIGPMLDVMTVDEAGVGAPREAAAAVAALERPAQGRGDDACLAAHVQRFTLRCFQNPHDSSIAAQPSYGFSGGGTAILELGRISRVNVSILGQRFRGSVHRDQVTIGGC